MPNFDQVVDNDDINVIITMGSPESVAIEGGKNLTPNISTDVSNGVLTLHNNNICDWLRSYKKSVINVYITMPSVTYITNAGVGEITGTDTITTSNFQVQTMSAGDISLLVNCSSILAHLFGTSDLNLKGKCGAFECNFTAGTGFVHCDSLNAGYVYLSTTTTGDCYVNSAGAMDIVINKNGNVYYTGSPTSISVKINGTGQLIHD